MKSVICFPPDVTYSYWLRLNDLSDSRDSWFTWCSKYFTLANLFPEGSPARLSCYESGFALRFVNTI